MWKVSRCFNRYLQEYVMLKPYVSVECQRLKGNYSHVGILDCRSREFVA